MANNKKPDTRNELDDFDIEGDSNFDWGDDGGLDLEPPKDDRSPITRAAAGFAEGAKDSIVSKDTLKKYISKSMPKEFGTTANLANTTIGSIRDLYNNSAKEVKPLIKDIKRTTGNMLPAAKGKIPQKLYDKLEAFSKSDVDQAKAEMDAREGMISSSMADIFKIEQAQRAVDSEKTDVKEKLRENIEQARHRDNLGQLDEMRKSLSILSEYKTNVESGYQRKSLELQFRQYFVLGDILEQTKLHVAQSKEALDGIKKNTGLPDFVKLRGTERVSEVLRNKFIDGATDTIIGQRKQFVSRFFGNLGKTVTGKIRGAVGDFRSGLDAANQAKEGMSMIDDPDMLAAMGGKEGLMGQMAGGMAGDYVADKFATKAGKKTRAWFEKREDLMSKFNRLRAGTARVATSATEYANSYDNGPMPEWLAKAIPDSLHDLIKDNIRTTNRYDRSLAGSADINLIDEPVQFSRRNSTTLNEIIPGYLARMYRELQIIRTGDDTIGMTSFDHTKNTFTGEKEAKKRAFEQIFKPSEIAYNKSKRDSYMDEFDPEGKLTKEQKEALGQFFADKSQKAEYLTRDKLGSADFFYGNEKTNKHAQAFSEYFKDYFDKNNDKTGGRFAKFVEGFNDVGDDIGDKRKLIQTFANIGMLPMLQEVGIVNKEGDSIDMNRYSEFMSGGASFDFGSDTDAKGTSGKGFGTTPTSGPAPTPKGGFFKRYFGGQNNPAQNNAAQNATIQSAVTNFDPVVAAIKEHSSKTASEQSLAVLERIEKKVAEGITVNHLSGFGPEMGERAKGFFNRTIGDTLRGAGSGIWKGIKGAKNLAQGGVGRAWDFAKGTGGFAKDLLARAVDYKNEVQDVYIKGKLFPAMTKAKLEAGEYYDKVSGKVITKFEDIKGAVVDKDGNIILTVEDMKKAFVKSTAGAKALDAMVKIKDMAVTGFGKAKGLVGGVYAYAWDMGKKGLGMAKDYLDEPYDVYVKGEEKPRLLAVMFRSGSYYSAATQDPILHPSKIDGPLLNVDANYVLTEEDMKKGLVDVKGNPVETGKFAFAKRMFGKVKQFGGMIGGMLKGAKDRITGLLGGAWDFVTNAFGKGGAFITTGGKTVADLLELIHDMLNDRLPASKKKVNGDIDGDGTREGSYKDLMAKRKAKKEEEDAKAKEEREKKTAVGGGSGGLLGMLGSLGGGAKGLLAKLGLGGGDEEGDSLLGDVDIDLDRKRPRGRRPNRWGRAKNGLKRGAGKAGNLLKRGAGKAGDLLKSGRARGMAGAAKNGVGAAARGAGTLARGAGSAGAGILRTGAGMLGRAALWGGGTLLSGAASATGTLASMALGATGSVVSGLASIVMSPVVLPALIAGGLAAGAYFGYKRLTRNKMGPLSVVRYVQYGFSAEDTQYAHLCKETEARMQDAVTVGQDGPKVNPKKVDYEAIVKIFDIDPEDAEAVEKFLRWFEGRFFPIFMVNIGVLKTLKPDAKIEDVDDLEGEMAQKFLKGIRFPGGPYDIMISPIADLDKLPSGPKEVEAIFASTEAELKKKPTGLGDKAAAGATAVLGAVTGAGAANAGAMPTAASAVGAAVGAAAPKSAANPTPAPSSGSFLSNMGAGIASAMGPIGAVITLAATVFGAVLPDTKTLDALSATKMKAYGLKHLDPDKVSALMSLERHIQKKVKTEGGKATWTGSPAEAIAACGGMFGITQSNQVAAEMWSIWLTKRFIPVYLNYVTNILLATKKPDPSIVFDTLTAKQKLDAALAVVATPQIWEVSASPWEKYELNMDPSSADANVAQLKSAAKSTLLGEDKTNQAKKEAADLRNAATAGGGSGTSVLDKARNAVSNFGSSVAAGASSILGKAGEAISNAGAAVGNAVGGAVDYAKDAMGISDEKPVKLHTGPFKSRPGYKALMTEMENAKLTNVEKASLMGNVASESGFNPQSENLNYSDAGRLKGIFKTKFKGKDMGFIQQFVKNPKALADYVYSDIGGYKYRGRGHIQLTGVSNYAKYSKLVFGDDRLVKDPDLANDPAIAAKLAIAYLKDRAYPVANKRFGKPLSQLSIAEAARATTQAVAGEGMNLDNGYLRDLTAKKVNYAQQFFGELQSGGGAPTGGAAVAATPSTPPAAGAKPAAAPAASGAPAAPGGKPAAAGAKPAVAIPVANQSATPATSAKTVQQPTVAAKPAAAPSASPAPAAAPKAAPALAAQQAQSAKAQQQVTMSNDVVPHLSGMGKTMAESLSIQKQSLNVLTSILAQVSRSSNGGGANPKGNKPQQQVVDAPLSFSR